ncbi:MAG: sigma-54 dependent transcriptional regulator [Ignavibacteria bacterium]|jgi:DNA-binding NtrC family response regulator|nr:sigma-54 dependent transcriptional regulator [Ignavibacteria bacterium]
MKALIVDDSVDFTSTLADIINSFGVETICSNSPKDAIALLENEYSNVGLILLDIEFGFGETMNGLDLLNIFRQQYPAIPVVMISGKGTIETAVKATKLGAINFVEKNIITKEKIRGIIDSTIIQASAYGDTSEIQNFLHSNGIIGKSKAITAVGESIIRYGRTDLNVLITGDTGTGKKLVANAIHSISRRIRAKIVTVDIPNVPKELFQSELFGHIKGSFAGATETKNGLFHQADRGTLFLDEIGDLPTDLQSHLLIPIEEKLIRKVGAMENEAVDIRFVSATNRNLLQMMKERKFSEQLYHRLRECEIELPSLAERCEDIPDIVNYFTTRHNTEFGDAKMFSPSTIDFLTDQKWNGNIRELYSFIKVILQTSNKRSIEVADVTKILSKHNHSDNSIAQLETVKLGRSLKEDLAEVDKIKIEKALSQMNGNVSKSAALLGVSRETLHNKIRRYEINTQQYRKTK